MSFTIDRMVVIGAGTMGGGIAAVAANAGIPVHLLDVAPVETTPDEKRRGLSLGDREVRDRIVAASFERLKRITPPAFLTPETADLVTIGNLEDDFDRVGEGDWIVEAIVERLEPKRALLERIEEVRKPGSIVSSNTSGLPIASLAAERSDEFAAHFLGTHFFNPPRYMKLVEVIPTTRTRADVLAFVTDLLRRRFEKGVVVCKDTPNFIANRYGSITAATALSYALAHGYTIEETDAILGPLVGRPKTALFRLYDLVGLDVVRDVGTNLYDLIPHDESREVLRDPRIVALQAAQIERGRLGDKSGSGFYKKPPRGEEGEILTLDLETMEYRPRREPDIPSAEATLISPLGERLRFVLSQDDRTGALARHYVYNALAYAARRIPEITDDLANVDRAVRWGFLHEAGPFEIWDVLGVRATVAAMRAAEIAVSPWVDEMLAAGCESFYRSIDGKESVYDPARRSYVPIVDDTSAEASDDTGARRRQMSGLDYFRKIMSGEVPASPMAELMGFHLVEIEEGRAVFELHPSERFNNGIGIVHGGVAATLLDSALGCAINTLMPAGKTFTTLEMKVNYVRPIRHETGALRCEATVLHAGGRTATAEGRIVDAEGRLYAHGTATCMLFRSL